MQPLSSLNPIIPIPATSLESQEFRFQRRKQILIKMNLRRISKKVKLGNIYIGDYEIRVN